MIILRRRQSTKQAGDLRCQNTMVVRGQKVQCLSKRLRFLMSEGPVDIYKCKDCGCMLRYHTVPLDSKGGIDELKAKQFEGLHSKMLGIPNLGRFRITRKVIAH